MRPLSIPVGRRDGDVRTAAQLIQTVGAYCSLSEQPLPLENWLLDTGDGSVYREVTAIPLPATLLLCHNCRDAHQLPEITVDAALNAMARSLGGAPPALAPARRALMPHLLLPNRDVTFRLGEESPFSYALEDVELVLTEDDEPVERRGSEPRVIVRARSGAAQATLDHFALNTRYFNADDRILRIPRAIFLSNYDRRVDQRTRVWRHATELARAHAELPPDLRQVHEDQVRRIAVAAGFWSVWVTVFDAILGDRALLTRLFGSPAGRGAEAPPLLHEAFPGTSEGWLA